MNISLLDPTVLSFLLGLGFIVPLFVYTTRGARPNSTNNRLARSNVTGFIDSLLFDDGVSIGLGSSTKLSRLTITAPADVTDIGGTTTVNASTTVTGVGTTFLSSLGVGDRISVSSAASTYAFVTAIASDTSLTVDENLGNGTSQTINKKASIFRLDDSSAVLKLVVDNLGRMGINRMPNAATLDIKNIDDTLYYPLRLTMANGNVLAYFIASSATLRINDVAGLLKTNISSSGATYFAGGNVGIGTINNINNALTLVGEIGFASADGIASDTILSREAAAIFQQGLDSATPIAQIFKGPDGSGTDIVGGLFAWAPGRSTGNAVPARGSIQGGAATVTSGTTQQTLIDRLIPNAFKVLTNNSAVAVVNATIANGTSVGGKITYTIEVWDGTDNQVETGEAIYSSKNKAGTVAGTITEVNSQQNLDSGTLATTWAISAANPAVISINANSSLTPSTGYPRITFSLQNLGQQAVAIQ